MRAKLANLNHCAVPFLSRAVVSLCWCFYTLYVVHGTEHIFIIVWNANVISPDRVYSDTCISYTREGLQANR